MNRPPGSITKLGTETGDVRLAALNLLLLALLLGVAAFGWYQLSSTRGLLGVHPEVIEELERSLDDQKELAQLQTDQAPERRETFERRQQLLNRLRILELSRDEMSRRLGAFVLVLLLTVSTLGAAVRLYERHRHERRLALMERALEKLAAGSTSVRIDDPGGGTFGDVARLIERVSKTVGVERQRLAELEQLAAWREGARRLGHEMRTPLTAIQLDLQSLRDQWQPATLDRLEGDFRFLQDFLVRFTASAKLPAPKLERIDLALFTSEFAAAFSSVWPGLELQLEGDLAERPATPTWVMADRELLRQVLVNLVSNAHQALEAGRGRVSFSIDHDEPYTSLWVSDDGPGIDPTIEDQLFQPHVSGPQQQSSKDPSGHRDTRLGLGLALSRMILLEHGGFLTLARNRARGSVDRAGGEGAAAEATGAVFRIELATAPPAGDDAF